MGKGNVCVNGKYEILFYVDCDELDIYYHREKTEECKLSKDIPYQEITNWVYDDYLSDENYLEFCDMLTESISKKIKSLRTPTHEEEREERRGRLLLINQLFRVVIVDNEWSKAVELLQNEDNSYNIENLQKKHFQTYEKVLKQSLFEQFDTLGIYSGPWTSGIISKKDYAEKEIA